MPFLEGPGEAEAQCAYLEVSGVTAGTITDDGDVLLFGGRKVYRHFFKDAAEFDLSTITAQLGMHSILKSEKRLKRFKFDQMAE